MGDRLVATLRLPVGVVFRGLLEGDLVAVLESTGLEFEGVLDATGDFVTECTLRGDTGLELECILEITGDFGIEVVLLEVTGLPDLGLWEAEGIFEVALREGTGLLVGLLRAVTGFETERLPVLLCCLIRSTLSDRLDFGGSVERGDFEIEDFRIGTLSFEKREKPDGTFELEPDKLGVEVELRLFEGPEVVVARLRCETGER